MFLGFEIWLGGEGVCLARAEAPTELKAAFDKANRLYEQGHFDQAAAAYDRLLRDAPGSASLHYNLGNALFKTGQIGKAIWNYRVALDLSPRDADIRANLQFARNTVGPPVQEERFRRWIHQLTADEWGLISGLLFWLMMGGMIAGQWRPQLRRSLRLGVQSLMVAWVLSALALGMALQDRSGKRIAIAVASGEIHYGPFIESQVHYAVQDGAELRILGSREGWLHVDDSRRGTGWIDKSLVVIYPPPVGRS